MCGIVLGISSIKYLTNDKALNSFQFTRADITDFIVQIKYPPILDYYTGRHYLEQAKKKEKEVLSKLTLLKVASQRLENALNYDFVFVREFYSESLFGAIKLDHKVIGDMDLIEEYLHERWKRMGENKA